MQRKPFIAGNWKMNKTISEAVVLAQEISNGIAEDWCESVDIVVCPPSLDLKPVDTVFKFDKIDVEIGAQNVYWETNGAYTGEVSIPMIKEAGCTYCIVGHSERRELFGETNEDINRKVQALCQTPGISPIVCVGESLAVRDEGTYIEYVDSQIRAAFAGIDISELGGSVVAYEPIWAIGTGRTATPEQAEEVCSAIRNTLTEIFGEEKASQMRILYGGSMNEGNAEVLLSMPNIDGGLIGGASLKSNSFLEIIKIALQES